MCHRNSGKAYERVLREEDLAVVEHHYPTISPAILRGVYECITDQNYPQPGVLIAVADLLYRDQQNLTGKYGIPVLPFSAMDLDNGERIQSRPMAAFHAVFESFSLAERNFRLLKEYLYEKL